jgi:hypothetical protein
VGGFGECCGCQGGKSEKCEEGVFHGN